MKRTGCCGVLSGLCALGAVTTATASAVAIESRNASVVSPHARACALLSKAISGRFHADRLGSALSYLSEVSGVEFDPLWADDTHAPGLDPETPVSLEFNDESVLAVAERVLGAIGQEPGTCGWQITERGTFQVGPKSRLNEFKRIELYPVADLLRDTPDFTNAPALDLQSALQNSGAGGAPVLRESPRGTTGAGPGGVEKKSPDTRARELIALIEQFIEPAQWRVNGGDGADIEYFQGTLIVRAPEYVHRQINGSRTR